MGQPLEHGVRTAVLGVRLAQAMDLSPGAQAAVFYTGLLHFAGCTADSEVDARFFGDELAVRPEMMAAFLGPRLELVSSAMRLAHTEDPPLTRAMAMAKSAFGGIGEFRRWAAAHCEVAQLLGARMRLPDEVQVALRHFYERWDGNGMPGALQGDQVPMPTRLVHVAQDADMAWQRGGRAVADRLIASRSGTGLDPAAAAAFLSMGEQAYLGLDEPSIWDLALGLEPGPQPVVCGERLDACLAGIADFADMKSMWTIGHSRGVADLAAGAGAVASLPDPEITLLRRAGLVHDIGRVAVPYQVWAKPGPLTRDERERVRLHAYHSERVLDVAEGLRPLARLAGSHGERCDGSGYHRGSRQADLPFGARLLAAADCYQAMREPRAYRPALSAEAAASELCREAEAGKLSPDAVNAVLKAVGQDHQPARRPAGLSERECEVLSLLTSGLATKQIAGRLGISPKTCDHHIQRLYRKLGVSTRTGATLFALDHGLLKRD